MPSEDLSKLTRWITRRIGPGISKRVKLAVEGDGVIFIDGKSVTNEDGPADLTITVAPQVLADVMSNKLDPLKAIGSGGVDVSNKVLAARMTPRFVKLLSAKPKD